MATTKKMSDAQLRKELQKLGLSPGPITDSTRGLYKKKLQNLKAENAKSQKTSKESERIWKSQENRRRRGSEPVEDDGGDWEDEEENLVSHRANVSSRFSNNFERRSYGGSRTLEGGQDRFYLDGKSVASTSHVGGTGLWRGDRSSLAGGNLSRGTAEYGDYLDYGHRSSFGRPRAVPGYSGSLEQEARTSLERDRYTGKIFEKSFMGHEVSPSLGVQGFTRDTTDYGASHDQIRSRLAGEKKSWSRSDEGRHWSRPSDWDAKGQRSYRNSTGLSLCNLAPTKPKWSRTIEYYLSKLVRALSVGLLIVFFGILIMKSGIFSSTPQNDLKLIPPDCDGKDDKYCQAMQKQIILQILSELYHFLSLEAGSFECGNPSGLSSKCIPIKRAKEHILNSSDHASEKFDSALQWLLDTGEHLGIWAKGEDGEIVSLRSLVACVESSRPRLGITCRLTNALFTAISNLFLALFGVFVLWLFLIYLRYHWRKLEEEEKQMYAMVEKIIGICHISLMNQT
uniref:LEM domain-containing protein n=1 Tax=Pyxicephalus adspersus TaxID=30357 RepID=A0AAV3AXW3_PYXAD|nr:TPA: hypothetical protein GDO54_001450 [Pyxicephalus adspersus]